MRSSSANELRKALRFFFVDGSKFQLSNQCQNSIFVRHKSVGLDCPFFRPQITKANGLPNGALNFPIYPFQNTLYSRELNKRFFLTVIQQRFYKGVSNRSLNNDHPIDKIQDNIQNPHSKDRHNEEPEIVYHAPFSGALRNVKRLSLTTCSLSVCLGPIVTFYTLPGMNVIAKGTVASVMILLSASTTFFLHWFTSPYIHKLKWKPSSDTMEVETLSWLATVLTKNLKISDVRPVDTNRPLANFSIDGTIYYVDQDNFPDKRLLKKLVK